MTGDVFFATHKNEDAFGMVDEIRWIPHYRLTISEHIERITRGFGSARVDLALSENSVS